MGELRLSNLDRCSAHAGNPVADYYRVANALRKPLFMPVWLRAPELLVDTSGVTARGQGPRLVMGEKIGKKGNLRSVALGHLRHQLGIRRLDFLKAIANFADASTELNRVNCDVAGFPQEGQYGLRLGNELFVTERQKAREYRAVDPNGALVIVVAVLGQHPSRRLGQIPP